MEQDCNNLAQNLDKPTDGQSEEERGTSSSSSGTADAAATVVVANGGSNSKHNNQILVQTENEFSTDDLRGNDTKILSLLGEIEGSNYTFKGMMRKLQIHQQSLSRALHRLEEMGLVERSHSGGYRLSQFGERNAVKATTTTRSIPSERREYMQLLQTYIPIKIRPTEIVNTLIGKWFRNLRWVGLIESGTGFTLQWTREDGSFQINLKMVAEYVVIETNAKTESEKLQAMVGSYAIYEQITKILQNRLAHGNAYVIQSPLQNN